MVKQVKRHTVSKKTKFGPKMVYKDKAWCQIEDTYSDNVCLMCPSTGHKSIFNSHDVTPDQSLFWRKPQEMTLWLLCVISSQSGIWWLCLHFLNGEITTSSVDNAWWLCHVSQYQVTVYLLRTRGSYWSRGPNRVPVNKWFWIWCINDGHGVSKLFWSWQSPKGREECAGW